MISRYSVKKPYTVVVAIVLVLILGVVSFGKMNTDLLPSMNLPYAIIMTTYQGASPETVETVVTKPVEQSMATVTDIENVSSRSRENMSLVVLEFQESTDMDSATIEIREKLDQISGYWDDSVGKPMIMKLNPDMMPIMISAVEIDGLEATEVTDYVEKNIQAELESIAGVASVSTTGNITESVEVLIREDKIQETNEKVMKALDQQFEEKEEELKEAQEELEDGKKKLQEGREELEEGKEQLQSGKDEMVAGLAEGQQQMTEAENQIAAGEAQIREKEQLLEEKQAELDAGRTQLAEGKAQAEEALEQLGTAQTGMQNLQQAISALAEQEAVLQENLASVTDGISAADAGLVQLEEFSEAIDYEQQRAELEQQKAGLEQSAAEIQNGLAALTAQKQELEGQLNQIVSTLGKSSVEEAFDYTAEQSSVLWNTLEELNTKETALAEGQAQLDAGREQLNAAKAQVASGKEQLSSGKIEMDTQKLLASIDMSVAESKIESGASQIEANEAKLEEAQEQIDSGREQLEEAKETAKDQASLKNLITSDLVKGILAGENFSMPAGYIQEGMDDYLVRVGDKFANVENLEDLVLMDLGLEGLDPIRLKDVADITMQDDSDEVYARLNGHPGVMLTIEKQTGYSTGEVTDRLLERIEEIEREQADVHFSVLMDQGVYIDLVVNSVIQNMLSGAVLAVLILLLFLKDIKPTIVIAFSIPISVVAAFVLMYFSGITLNVISLSGLALGIGMLVDNSIVVIENIERLRQEGMPAKKAAIEGARQVAGAIAASTLTTICVFAPIVFTEGITRQLFVDMGLTIAYSLIASLVVALTLVPMMSAGLLRKSKPKKFRFLDAVRKVYGKLLAGALRVKFLVLLLAVLLFVGSAAAALKKGTSFMPEMESTQVSMTITTETGTPFEETTACADEVIASIEDLEDIESIGAMAGGGGMASMMGMGSSGTNTVSVYLLLKEDKKLSGEELEKEILKRTKDFPCEVDVATQSMDMSALGGSGIQVRIKGKELDQLTAIAKDVAAIVEATEGTQNVSDGQEESDAEFRIAINKARAMEHKLTVAQVYQEVQKRLAEASSATTLSTEEKDYSVYVRDEKDEKLTREDLKNLTIKVTNNEGKEEEIRLSEIADFTEASGPQTILRDAQSRYMTVSAEIASGYNIGLVSADVEKELEDYELPGGYTLEMTGEDETINDAMGQLMLMLFLALVFMYLIMVAQFQSLLSPFIIMFTIPLAFTGGFLGLLAAGMDVSVIAVIGFIMLSGIIVNNGIVLVDYTNQLRMEGLAKREALVQAGKDRFRPIIMTALTTILGLSTMAAGMGMGGDMVQPMAVVTIGGLIYGTLLTLFVVPCIYDLLNRKEYKKDEVRLEDTAYGD
ncbi:MAG: efflux RND transporter permease subunit [Eubacteriales bacterium]|nr:efflux RND transporter permease subunit [Eubacteriales bacterium]